MNQLTSLGIVAAVALWGASATLLPASAPWPDGETLVYAIDWGLVRAAQATFSADDKDDHWIFHLNLLSQGPVDTFYPINDWFWSLQQKSPWRCIEYGEDRSEHTRRICERTRFYHEKKLAMREKWTKAEVDRIALPDSSPVDDIGSMLYSLRRGNWSVGDKRPIVVVESSAVKTGEATCVAIEKKKFDPWPECEVIQVHCLPTGETAQKQKGQLTVWMTNDARRIPLHATLEFKYGTFDISLTAATPGFVEALRWANRVRRGLSTGWPKNLSIEITSGPGTSLPMPRCAVEPCGC